MECLKTTSCSGAATSTAVPPPRASSGFRRTGERRLTGTEQRTRTGQTRARGTAGEIIQIKIKYFTRKRRVSSLFERLNGPMLFCCRIRDVRHKRVLLSSAVSGSGRVQNTWRL